MTHVAGAPPPLQAISPDQASRKGPEDEEDLKRKKGAPRNKAAKRLKLDEDE